MSKKNIIYILIGIFISGLITLLAEAISGMIYPHPEGIDFKDTEAVAKMMAEMPVNAYILLATGWFVSIFIGTFVTGYRSATHPIRNGLIVGAVFFLLTLLNLIALPHPLWFIIFSLGLIFPFAYLGGKVGSSFNQET